MLNLVKVGFQLGKRPFHSCKKRNAGIHCEAGISEYYTMAMYSATPSWLSFMPLLPFVQLAGQTSPFSSKY